MAGFSDRVAKAIAKARLETNDAALSQMPRQAIEQALQEMQQGLQHLRLNVASAINSQKHIECQLNQAQTEAASWKQRAQLAIQKGDESLARAALMRRKSWLETVDNLTAQLKRQFDAIASLQVQQIDWEIKLAEAQVKKQALIERAGKATNSQLQNTLGRFGCLEDRMLQMEARSQATAELSGLDLETQFAMLESGSGVDAELAEMKAQLLGTKADNCSNTISHNPNRANQDPVADNELEALKRKLDEEIEALKRKLDEEIEALKRKLDQL